jgi:hypothetical protein
MKRLTAVILIVLLGMIAAPRSEAAPEGDNAIDLNFRGGSIGTFIRYVREAAGGQANVVVSQEAAALPLDPFELHRVDFHTAVRLLDGMKIDTEEGLVALNVDYTSTGGENTLGVYTITCRRQGAHPGPRVQGNLVLTVADLLAEGAGLSAEDILTAIQTALELISDEAAQIRFHEETGLIITRGTNEQVSTITQVVEQLRESVIMRQRRERGDEIGQRDAEIEHLKRIIDQRQVERDTMMMHMEQRLAQMETELSQRERIIGMLQDQISELEKERDES